MTLRRRAEHSTTARDSTLSCNALPLCRVCMTRTLPGNVQRKQSGLANAVGQAACCPWLRTGHVVPLKRKRAATDNVSSCPVPSDLSVRRPHLRPEQHGEERSAAHPVRAGAHPTSNAQASVRHRSGVRARRGRPLRLPGHLTRDLHAPRYAYY
eukprot:IDg21888t1